MNHVLFYPTRILARYLFPIVFTKNNTGFDRSIMNNARLYKNLSWLVPGEASYIIAIPLLCIINNVLSGSYKQEENIYL